MKEHNVLSVLFLYLPEFRCIVKEVKDSCYGHSFKRREMYWVMHSLFSMFSQKNRAKMNRKTKERWQEDERKITGHKKKYVKKEEINRRNYFHYFLSMVQSNFHFDNFLLASRQVLAKEIFERYLISFDVVWHIDRTMRKMFCMLLCYLPKEVYIL